MGLKGNWIIFAGNTCTKILRIRIIKGFNSSSKPTSYFSELSNIQLWEFVDQIINEE